MSYGSNIIICLPHLRMFGVMYIKSSLHKVCNKYFKLKRRRATNSNYLLTSATGPDATTCQNKAIKYRKYEHTVSPRHGHADTDRLCIQFPLSLNLSSIRVVTNNLASHTHVILPSHIVFLRFKT